MIDELGRGDGDAKDDFWSRAYTGGWMDGGTIHQHGKHWRSSGLHVHEWGKEEIDYRFSVVHIEFNVP